MPLLLLCHVINDVHDLLAKGIGFLHSVCLRVYTNDRLGVALAQVYPLVGKVNLHTIDVGNLLVLVEVLNLLQNAKDVGSRIEVDTVLAM